MAFEFEVMVDVGADRGEGSADNLWAWVAKANLFVFPPRLNGFPIALDEALAYRTPTVTADCRFGPRELVEYDKSG